MIDKKYFWDRVTKSGLTLGGISILFMLISLGLSELVISAPKLTIITKILSPLFWIAKIFICIKLLKYFLKKYYESNISELNAHNVLNFGRMTALLSAALFAAFNMAYYMYINPDFFEQTLSSLNSLNLYTAEQMNTLKEIAPQIPTYAFFGTLIYCYLFGSIASSIIIKKLVSHNPFV